MKKATIQWGVRGAAAVVAFAAFLFLLQASLPDDSTVRRALRGTLRVLVSPVMSLWEGVRGIEHLLPVLGSVFLYLAVLGFALGVLLGKATKRI